MAEKEGRRIMIKLREINKRYDELRVFDGLNIDLAEEGVNFIIGPSGSGKTTLVNIIAGADTDYGGSIDGLAFKNKAMVFQEDRLIDGLSVSLNIRLMMKEDKISAVNKIKEALKNIGMEGLETRKACELSGGQRRRAAILRSVLANRDFLIFDEALQGIDDENKDRLMRYILPLIKDKTIVWISHDQREIKYFSEINMIDMEKIDGVCSD